MGGKMSEAFYLLIAQSDLLKLHTPVLLKDAKKLAADISKETGERVHVFKHVYDVEHINDAVGMPPLVDFLLNPKEGDE
jgi:hypothetical protein